MFNSKGSILFSGLVLLPYYFILIISCNDIPRNNSHPDISNSDIKKGKALAAIYCQSCHALPDPGLLDAKTWEKGVLPVMGPRLGIFDWNGTHYRVSRYDMSLGKDFYPAHPVLTSQQWKSIVNYFIASAPDSLAEGLSNRKPINMGLALFSPKAPLYDRSNPAATSMVGIAQQSSSLNLISSDALKHTLYRYDREYKAIDSIKTRGPVVDVEIKDNNWLVCDIGVLNPNNGRYGAADKLSLDNRNKLQPDSKPLFDGLPRPVEITAADFNNDGKQDYLVCGFGYLTGALSWMENKGNGKYDPHVLRPLPGAIKAYINDYNHDGLQDFWVLFAQGEEGIFLFTNRGNGQFDQKQVLRFPPVYGSSYFEFDDFNKDGYPDILYTCGDNADYSNILKPYHGLYIFLNDGKNNFKQKYFFHINGCFKAMARDFDDDGDLDIGAISFFADYKNRPEEGFVYLENKGDYNFDPCSIPETQQGRWLTMDAGDINGDGKIDLILGNFSIGPAMSKSKYDWKKGPPFMVLENTGKK